MQKMMIDALVGEGLEVGLLQVLQGYWRAVGRLPKQSRIFFFNFRCHVFLVSLEKKSGESMC